MLDQSAPTLHGLLRPRGPFANVLVGRPYRVVKSRENPYHDEGGHFTDPAHSVDGSRVSTEELTAVRSYVADKWANTPPPSDYWKQQTLDLVAKYGPAEAESRLRGNVPDRAAARQNLYDEAVAKTGVCACPYCGVKLQPEGPDEVRVSRDRLWPQSEGGRYTLANTVGTCVSCNEARGDTSMSKLVESWGLTAAAAAAAGASRAVAARGGVLGQATGETMLDGDDVLDGMTPQKVTGDLRRTWVETLHYEQVTVNGQIVDPASVVETTGAGEG